MKNIKWPIDYDALNASMASVLFDSSKPIIVNRFLIHGRWEVFAPVQFIHASISRAKSRSKLLRELAIESLQSIATATRI